MLTIKKIIESFYNLIRLYPIWIKLKNNDFLFFCDVADMGETLNGKIYSKLLDPIFEQLRSKGFSCLHITSGTSHHGKETYNNSLSYDHLRLFYRQWWRIKTNLLKLCITSLPLLYKIETTNDFDSDFFKDLLSTSNVKAIFCVGALKKLCEQASVKGVKVLEVLHGIGYSPLPPEFDAKFPIEQLPDIILSFDDVSTKTFNKLSKQNKLEVIQIENYWYSKFKTCSIPIEWKNPIEKKHFKKVVLYSLQWGFDGEHELFDDILDNGIIPNSILELIKHTEDEVLWLLRLHPVQLRSDRYESHRLFIEELSLNNTNTEYLISSTLPLPSVLSFADVHISMMSMTAYDAAYFGIKSLLLCPTLNTIYSSMFLDLQSVGYAKKNDYKDTESILHWILHTNRIKPYLNNNPQRSLTEVLENVLCLEEN